MLNINTKKIKVFKNIFYYYEYFREASENRLKPRKHKFLIKLSGLHLRGTLCGVDCAWLTVQVFPRLCK
jgi:hypothetical protein